MSMFTNSDALAVELEVIKQQLKKTTNLSKTTKVEPCLSQSKSFLNVLNVFYQNSNTSLPITPTQMTAALSSSSLFKNITLASLSYIIETFPNSDMPVI